MDIPRYKCDLSPSNSDSTTIWKFGWFALTKGWRSKRQHFNVFAMAKLPSVINSLEIKTKYSFPQLHPPTSKFGRLWTTRFQNELAKVDQQFNIDISLGSLLLWFALNNFKYNILHVQHYNNCNVSYLCMHSMWTNTTSSGEQTIDRS